MIRVYEGDVGAGKSLMLSRDLMFCLQRNRIWFEKGITKIKRKVACNFPINKDVVAEYGDLLVGWEQLEQLTEMEQTDVFMDDMATLLDSKHWEHTPFKVRKWFRVHERMGCDFYSNAQNFSEVEISIRRLTNSVVHVQKFIGSQRPMATKPVIRRIWGVLFLWEVPREQFTKERYERKYEGIPRVEFIRKTDCAVYDTAVIIKDTGWPPLEHIERSCNTCGKVKAIHL